MSHRAATNATHYLTVERREQTGTDDYDSPIYDTTAVLQDEPVEYRPAGKSYVRGDTGERVRRSPSIKGRAGLLEDVQEGDDVTLTPIGGDGPTIDGLEARAVNPNYGRGAAPTTIEIELEDV